MKSILIIVLMLSTNILLVGQNAFNPLTPGKHNVGFTQINLPKEGDVNFVISLWYPAKKGDTQITLGEYITSENLFKRKHNDLFTEFASTMNFFFNEHFAVDSLKSISTVKASAYQNAEMLNGKFPLVLALAASSDYFTTFEFLASHGSVVASISCNYTDNPPSPDGPDHYTRYTDALAKLFTYTKTKPYADQSNITLLGHGFSANPAMYLAMRTTGIKNVINLDGGFFGLRSKSEKSSDYRPMKFQARLLYVVSQDQIPQDNDQLLLEFRRNITQLNVNDNKFLHHDFTSYALFRNMYRHQSSATIDKTFVEIHRVLLEFLNGQLISATTVLTRKPKLD